MALTLPQVGPVIDPRDPNSRAKYEGQYISAGYTGHGMPRAFAWYVYFASLSSFGQEMLMQSEYSAEAVAGMIKADISGKKWTSPEWFPAHYLTTKEI